MLYARVLEFVKSRKYITKKLIAETFGCSDDELCEIMEKLKREEIENKFNQSIQPLLRRSKPDEWVVSVHDTPSRTSSCIKMLMLLFTRDVVPVADIAEELETNPRNIPEYKKELEAAGYTIDTVRGQYGGYRLNKTEVFPTVRLTDAEKRAMVESFEYITKRGDLPSMPAYKKAMEKMMARNQYRSAKDTDLIMIPRYPLAMSEEDLQERYSALLECVDKHLMIKINFRSSDNVVRERVVHPYKLYMYNNAWFTLAYCEEVKDLRYFKLTRIVSFERMSKKFDYIYSYREGSEWHEWLDDSSMKKVVDWSESMGGDNATMRVKLRLSGKPAMYVKEYLYGADQVITEIDKDTTILEFTAQYKYNVLQLVLGFGADCEVLEPAWLMEEVISQTEKIKTVYNKQ